MSEELRGLEPFARKCDAGFWLDDVPASQGDEGQVMLERLHLYETHVPALLDERDAAEEKALQATAFCNSLAKSLAGANTKVSELLDTIARLQSELAEARERAEAAEGERPGAICCEHCDGWSEWDGYMNAFVCKRCGAFKNWRGPQGREGAENEEH